MSLRFHDVGYLVVLLQFMFEVSKDDEAVIELTQKMQRLPGVDRETIGFTIMQVISYTLHIAYT